MEFHECSPQVTALTMADAVPPPPAPADGVPLRQRRSPRRGSAIAAAPQMCCKKYTCDQCKEACTLAESKPKGSNPDIRIEKICKGNRRNMEKRVKRRPETRDDPLRKLWSAIIADKDKLAAWSRKMKTRKHYEHNEITMEVIEEEVKRFIMEQRIQKEYYCFATLQEENENLSEEEQIKLWKKRVERSKDKLEKNGILYIAKAPKLLVSEIEQNEANQSIRRSQETPDAATLEKAHEQALANLAKSQAHMQQEHGHQDNLEIPAEAEDVDHVLHNRGRGSFPRVAVICDVGPVWARDARRPAAHGRRRQGRRGGLHRQGGGHAGRNTKE